MLLPLFLTTAMTYSTDELATTRAWLDELVRTAPPTTAYTPPSTGALTQPDTQWLAQQARLQAEQRPTRPQPDALYFASFSMPEGVLKPLIQDAYRFGIPVSLRGLHAGDMRQTANAVLALVEQDNQGGVEISPQAFREWGVTGVPTLIVRCGTQHDRIVGNLSTLAALTKVAAQGECRAVAQRLLQHAGETP